MLAHRFLRSLLAVVALGAAACGDDAADAVDAGGDTGLSSQDASMDARPDAETPDASSLDATGTEDAEDRDAGETPGVVVANEGGTALYHGLDGALLAVRQTPSEFPLPRGGHVTLIVDRIYTFTDVPNLSRIEVRGAPPRKSETLQSLQIDVPPSPEGKPISISTGCSGASGPGTHLLPITSACLAADDSAEIWIYAYDGGSGHYIHVDDIPIGNASAPPRVVVPGAWVPFPASPPELRLTELRPGYQPSLTTYALRGDLPVHNLTSGFAMSSSTAGVSTLASVIPELGLEWRQSLAFEIQTSDPYATWTRTLELRSRSHPLASTSSVSGDSLLPVPSNFDLDAESGFLSWRFDGALPPTIDRVRISFHEDSSDRVWEIWMPADRRELQLPSFPAELVSMLPNPDHMELRAEDRTDISEWTQVLDGWMGEINFETSPWDWPSQGLVSSRWFVP